MKGRRAIPLVLLGTAVNIWAIVVLVRVRAALGRVAAEMVR